MQAIFPISMVIAVLAAIGIAFLLPSLLLSRTSGDYAVVPSHSTVGLGRTNISAANWGRTGAVAVFRQGNTQPTLNPISQLLGMGNSAQQGDKPSEEAVAIMGQDGPVGVIVPTPEGPITVLDPLELKKQEFEYELLRRAGYVRRRPSRKQRRSRRN
jgi:hypothetical protein